MPKLDALPTMMATMHERLHTGPYAWPAQLLLRAHARDLGTRWHVASTDPSLLDRYAAATGAEIDKEALTLYRLWFDLAEIGEYLTLFRSPHDDTADTSESWKNLKHFLRPADRWPHLVRTP